MAVKKLAWKSKSILPICLKPRKDSDKSNASEPNPMLKLSLSDISSSSSPLSFGDLSVSLVNVHSFMLSELKEMAHGFSRSYYLGDGGFGTVYKGFVKEKLRPCLMAQAVAVKVLDLDGPQGHREWLVRAIW